MRKIKHYEKWKHNKHIIPFAFDSAGNIAPRTLEFINKLFAASNQKYNRTWNSEKERIILKNWFLNKLSMILAKQRVIDLNKSLAVPLAERKDKINKYRMYIRNKKQTKVLKQREEMIHNSNQYKLFSFVNLFKIKELFRRWDRRNGAIRIKNNTY